MKVILRMYQIECTDTHANTALEVYFMNVIFPLAII